MKSIKETSLAFIDLETTGFNPDQHEIIELGCIVVSQPELKVLAELDLKIKPEHIETAEPEALQVNGYNSGDWLFAADLPQALKALNEKAEGAIMVSHNITFDWPFLQHAFAKTKIENKLARVRLDLLSMAFIKLCRNDRVQRFNLGALAEFFNLKNDQAHTAMADIRVSLEIYKKLLTC